MDLVTQKYYYPYGSSQDLSPTRSPPSPSLLLGTNLHSSNNFPIIAVAIIGIFATGLLLVSYYVFVIKCCLNWHRIDLLRRFSFSRRRQGQDPLMTHSSAVLENRGLDEAVIRSIPIFRFKKDESKESAGGKVCECAVCLNEFQDEEKLRVIPNCGHVFHIDCIDVWLQNNANCPLCRTSISATPTFPLNHQVIAPSSSPQRDAQIHDNFIGNNEDYVVIELIESPNEQSFLSVHERLDSEELYSLPSISPPTKSTPKLMHKKRKKLSHGSSMGDECIDIRGKDHQFQIQPVRRSFSMDSATDRQLYLAVQEILQQNKNVNEVISFSSSSSNSNSEGCSSRVRRSFFSFGHGRGSKTAVLPVHLES